MKNISRLLAFLLIALFAALSTACTVNDEDMYASRQKPSRDSDGSKIPWARPANWEGGLPGMGTGNMPNQY